MFEKKPLLASRLAFTRIGIDPLSALIRHLVRHARMRTAIAEVLEVLVVGAAS